VRSEIEAYIEKISTGERQYSEVLEYVLNLYKKKYFQMRDSIDKIVSAYKKFFDIDQGNYLKSVKDIKSKPNPHAVVAKKKE